MDDTKTPKSGDSIESINSELRVVENGTAAAFVFSSPVNLRGLTGEGRTRFELCVQNFANDFAREVANLEAADRPNDVVNPEVTASVVSQAFQKFSEGKQTVAGKKSAASRADLAIQIIGMITLGGAGVCGSYLEERWQVSVFTLLAVIAIISNTYTIVRRL